MEKEITLKYLLQILKKYAAIIIVVSVLLAAASGVFVSLTTKPTYSSTAKVLINYSYGDNILTPSGQMNELNYTLAIMPTIIETLESYDFLEKVNDAAGLEYSHRQMKSLISYKYSDDSKIVSITIKTPNSAHTKKVCEAFAAVVPEYVEELNFGHFDFVEKFRSPTKNTYNLMNTCSIIFAITFVLMYAICFVIYEISNKRVNENTDLAKRYQLPIIGKIPDFNSSGLRAINKEGGYYEKEGY